MNAVQARAFVTRIALGAWCLVGCNSLLGIETRHWDNDESADAGSAGISQAGASSAGRAGADAAGSPNNDPEGGSAGEESSLGGSSGGAGASAGGGGKPGATAGSPSTGGSTGTAGSAGSAGSSAVYPSVVQVSMAGILDARSVTTINGGGSLVPFTLSTDGGGLQNGLITQAVALHQGGATATAHALPNDGKFPSTPRHPEVVLQFSNTASDSAPQTHLFGIGSSVVFTTPPAAYGKIFLFFTGAAGGTTLKATLKYGSTTEVQNATIPDYYADVPTNDPVLFNLASDLSKWTKTSSLSEASHHNLTGVELTPNSTKVLTSIQLERGPNGYLIFWGATGIAIGPGTP